VDTILDTAPARRLGRRPNFSTVFKRKVVEASYQPGTSVSVIARRRTPGYEDFLAALVDPNHPEHEAMLEWHGDDGFDPTTFDCEWVNQWLKQAKV
jgi:hypothetical protein